MQWVSAHSWVMLICTFCIPKVRAYSSNSCYIACFLIMDPTWLYIWIPPGRIFLKRLFFAYSIWCLSNLWLTSRIFYTCCSWKLYWISFQWRHTETSLSNVWLRHVTFLIFILFLILFPYDQVSNFVWFLFCRLRVWNLVISMICNMWKCTLYLWFNCRLVGRNVWWWKWGEFVLDLSHFLFSKLWSNIWKLFFFFFIFV